MASGPGNPAFLNIRQNGQITTARSPIMISSSTKLKFCMIVFLFLVPLFASRAGPRAASGRRVFYKYRWGWRAPRTSLLVGLWIHLFYARIRGREAGSMRFFLRIAARLAWMPTSRYGWPVGSDLWLACGFVCSDSFVI